MSVLQQLTEVHAQTPASFLGYFCLHLHGGWLEATLKQKYGLAT